MKLLFRPFQSASEECTKVKQLSGYCFGGKMLWALHLHYANANVLSSILIKYYTAYFIVILYYWFTNSIANFFFHFSFAVKFIYLFPFSKAIVTIERSKMRQSILPFIFVSKSIRGDVVYNCWFRTKSKFNQITHVQ